MNPIKVFIGFILIMLGLALLALKSGNVQYGSVFIIGPIPIVLASSPELALIGILIAVILMLTVLLMVR